MDKTTSDETKQQANTDKAAPAVWAKRLRWVAFFSAVLSFVPFLGYSYLRSYLNAFGFHSPLIDPSLHELFYFSLEAATSLVVSLFTKDFWAYLFSQLLNIGIGGVAGFLLVLCYAQYGDQLGNLLIQIRETKRLPFFANVPFINKIINVCCGLVLSFLAPVFVYAGVFFVAICGVVLIWVALASGVIIGLSEGNSKFQENQCSAFGSDQFKNKEKLVACTRMAIAGDMVSGIVIYTSKQRTYFVSNCAGYVLDAEQKLIAEVPYYFRADTKLLETQNPTCGSVVNVKPTSEN